MAFTSTYSTILSSQTDADSPLDVTLMDGIRQNIDYLFEYIGGKTYTPSTSHNHDGANSRAVASVASSAVAVAQLKLSTGSASGNIQPSTSATVTLNRYAHFHQSYGMTFGGGVNDRVYMVLFPHTSTALQTGIGIRNGDSTASANYGLSWDYHAT